MIANEETCAQTAQLSNVGSDVATVSRLNDDFRRTCSGGTLAVTAGALQLGHGALPVILAAVRGFSAFTPANDPYGEHDFGSINWRGTKLFWKIDCYDRELRYGSPDPADPNVTTRVLTIMLAAEY